MLLILWIIKLEGRFGKCTFMYFSSNDNSLIEDAMQGVIKTLFLHTFNKLKAILCNAHSKCPAVIQQHHLVK